MIYSSVCTSREDSGLVVRTGKFSPNKSVWCLHRNKYKRINVERVLLSPFCPLSIKNFCYITLLHFNIECLSFPSPMVLLKCRGNKREWQQVQTPGQGQIYSSSILVHLKRGQKAISSKSWKWKIASSISNLIWIHFLLFPFFLWNYSVWKFLSVMEKRERLDRFCFMENMLETHTDNRNSASFLQKLGRKYEKEINSFMERILCK